MGIEAIVCALYGVWVARNLMTVTSVDETLTEKTILESSNTQVAHLAISEAKKLLEKETKEKNRKIIIDYIEKWHRALSDDTLIDTLVENERKEARNARITANIFVKIGTLLGILVLNIPFFLALANFTVAGCVAFVILGVIYGCQTEAKQEGYKASRDYIVVSYVLKQALFLLVVLI
ncbi:gp169 [Listeria phage A511]|uniref:Gp169 n=1 Tax=Listeria phage A511 TaxID=2908169 RepID=A8AT03_BPA51|nr:gp169 [Listeria phage A511]AAY52950.1 gp169 [Listeria phage A511]